MVRAAPKYTASVEQYVARLPRPVRTGNLVDDEQNEATHRCLQNALRDMLQDRNHIMPTWTFLDERKRKNSIYKHALGHASSFETASSFSAIKEKEFFITWLASKGDANNEDILTVTEQFPSALEEMMVYATGVGWNQKLPDELIVREVMQLFLDARHDHMGLPMRDLKERMEIPKTDKLKHICWLKVGLYEPVFGTSGELETIRVGATTVKVPPGNGINRKWKLLDNFDLFSASFQFGSLAPQKLVNFFDAAKKEGPHAYQSFTGKPKELAKVTAALMEDFRNKQKANHERVNSTGAVKERLQAVKKTKAKASLSKARESAATVLAAKKARRSLSFET